MKQSVASFWYTPSGGKGISKLEFLTIKSWLDNGFKFILYTYNLDDAKLKTLTEYYQEFSLKDAGEIVPLQEFFSDDRGGGIAAFSDYFRFRMIQQTGMPWVDMDMVCLNYSEILKQDYVFVKEKQKSGGQSLTTSVMKFPAHSDFGEKLIRESEKTIGEKKMVDWGIIGPVFFARCVKEANLEHHALDAQVTCQIPWFQAAKFVSRSEKMDDTQFCLHLYTDGWRQEGLYKNAIYPENCIYSRLLTHHSINDLMEKCHYHVGFYDKYIHSKICRTIARVKKMKHRIFACFKKRVK